jgi:putative redox protein
VAITKGLNQKGRATFTFDFSKTESGIDVEKQVKDITHIVEHFKAYDEIILVGASFGALSTSIATVSVPRVKGLVTLGGFFGSIRLGREHRTTLLKFRVASLVIPRYKRIWKYFKHGFQPKRIAVPVLVIHSKADKTVYIAQSRHFFAKVEAPKQFVTLATADHNLTARKDTDTVIAEIDTWLGTI